MLQFNALRPDTLDVLKVAMGEPLLNDFVLVGGTALALHYGHRISEDIDLFVWEKFDVDLLLLELSKTLNHNVTFKTPIGAHIFIKWVKTDLVYFPANPIRPIIEKEGIRLLSTEDISAMKMNVIANRGAKKDFYDVYFLLKEVSLEKQLEFFKEKFKTQDVFGLSRSITYFADADMQNEITLLKEKSLTWEKVKQTIIEEIRKLL